MTRTLTSEPQSFKLGSIMLKAVLEKLEDTFSYFYHSSPKLSRAITEIYSLTGEEGNLSDLSLRQITAILQIHSSECHIVTKLLENLHRDIYLRQQHYKYWLQDPLYLDEQTTLSSACVFKVVNMSRVLVCEVNMPLD